MFKHKYISNKKDDMRYIIPIFLLQNNIYVIIFFEYQFFFNISNRRTIIISNHYWGVG